MPNSIVNTKWTFDNVYVFAMISKLIYLLMD